jgi:hypothetical protein
MIMVALTPRALRRGCVLVCLLLAGCGGGGGGPAVTLSPSPLTGSFQPSQLPAQLRLDVAVPGGTASPAAYLLVSDSAGTFQAGALPLSLGPGSNRYFADLPTNAGLGLGAHAGSLKLEVCGDAACGADFGGASLPYTITVQPPVVVSGTPDLEVAVVQGSPLPLALRLQGAATGGPLYAMVGPGDAATTPASRSTPATTSCPTRCRC